MTGRLLSVLVLLLILPGVGWQSSSGKAVIDGPVHEGVEVTCDLPVLERVHNFGAPRDGTGLCVFASLDMLARWHHIRELTDIIHKIQMGGGYPSKVDAVLKEFAPGVHFLQYEGVDPSFIEFAMAQRSPVGITLGYSERYKDQNGRILPVIYHMVVVVHFDSKWACILDNNFVGTVDEPDTLEWMPRKVFLERAKHPSGKFWGVRFFEAPPPAIPWN